MTDDTDDAAGFQPEDAARQSRERINQIGVLFSEMKNLMDRWLAEEGPADLATGKKMLAKMGELQTAHLMMLRAEEDFYDKFSQDAASDTTDYDAIRAELGRALDRIREAEQSDTISDGHDGSAVGGDPLSV